MPDPSNREALSDGEYTVEEVLDALHWCRLGRVRPKRDGAFYEAERRGLLAHDPVWHTTVEGEIMLAKHRPNIYGAREMAIKCSFCGVGSLEPCVVPSTGRPFRPRDKYQFTHQARHRAADAR